MHRFLPKALAVLFGTLLALGIGEAVVRLAGAAPEVAEVQRGRLRISANPRLLFEPVPKMEVAGVPSGAEEYRGVSNSLGYRDREHAPAKPPGVYRIVVIGDSITAGYQVERTEDTFPALLEAALQREGHEAGDAGDADDAGDIEVLNFGVTGYNTAQEVETLRSRALRFAPDLVILAYCHNDRRPPDPRILAGLREARGGRAVLARTQVNRALAWSALYRLARYGQEGEETEEAAPGPAPAGDAVDTADTGNSVEPSLRELAALSRQHRFEVLLAVFPYLPKPYEKEHARHHAWLAERAREHGFRHLDLRPAFRACRKVTDEKLGFDRYHPTAAGHRCAAGALTDAVRGILP